MVAVASGEGKFLESWKEISAYLKRSERTCRRWEETLDLPIHRLDGTPNARVFAYTDEIDRWFGEKLHHLDNDHDAEEIAARRRTSLRRLLAASGVGAVALIVLGRVLFWSSPPPPLPTVKPSLAVLPFANATGDAALDPWQTALSDLITVDLGQSRYVNVVRITELLRALVSLKLDGKVSFSSDDLNTVAAKVRVDHVATGSFVGSGPGGILIIAVHTITPGLARPPQEFRVGFENEGQALSVADAMTRKIKLALDLTPAHVSRDLDRDVRCISTASPSAFKLFSQGYRLLGIADFSQGASLLVKAVDEDPQFALAYKYLFRGCEDTLRKEDAKKYAAAAFRLADRMSEREKGEFVYLFHDRYTGDQAKKIEALERLCRLYPDDRFGSTLLLGVYARRNDWAKGFPIAERAWNAHKGDINLTTHLAQFYENTGRAEDAERVISELIDANPDHEYLDSALIWRASLRIRMGKYEHARADIDRMDALYPNRPPHAIFRAYVFLHEGKLDEAERILEPETEAGEPGHRIEALLTWSDVNLMRGRFELAADKLRRGLEIVDRIPGVDEDRALLTQETALHAELAYLFRLMGRLTEALDEVDRALQASSNDPGPGYPPPEIRRLKGLILLDLGRTDAFAALADDVLAASGSGTKPWLISIYDDLLGCRELKAGHPEKAIEYLSRAVDLISVPGNWNYGPNPAPFYDLAEAYAQEQGAYYSPRAVSLYEKVVQPSLDWTSAGDFYALSFYHMGRHFEFAFSDPYTQASDKSRFRARAVASYRQFLSLWENAEPPFTAQVEDARRRLAALGAQESPGKPRM